MKQLRRSLPIVVFMLLVAENFTVPARADWSPDFLIWQNPENVPGGTTQAFFAIDDREHVHLVYTHKNRLVSDPIVPRTYLKYMQFDDWGHIVVDQILVNDSVDYGAGRPKMILFGQDSLWIMWWTDRPDFSSFTTRTLDLDGNILSEIREWPLPYRPDAERFVFDALPDRTVVFATADAYSDEIRLTVQSPTGERIHDGTVIWAQYPCDRVDGFVDYTDSLQVVWRQYPSWQAVLTKRVNVRTPFDSTQISSFAPLTPMEAGNMHSAGYIVPYTDSLMILSEQGGDQLLADNTYLHVIRRDSYEELASVRTGRYSYSYPLVALEGNTQISTVVYGDSDRSLHFRRYQLPELSLVEDTVLARPIPEWTGVLARSYFVSPAGIRHLLYARITGTGPGGFRLYYRFWREDLAAPQRPTSAASALSFTIYPNPANDRISFLLPGSGELLLYDILGRLVLRRSTSGMSHSFQLSTESLTSGTYCYVFRRDGLSESARTIGTFCILK